jgi:hypothetical protein
MLVVEGVLLLLLTSAAVDFVAITVLPLYAREVASQYALGAAVRADGSQLDPQSTFLPHQPHSLLPPGHNPDDGLAIEYQSTRVSRQVSVALLVDASGYVVASTYPAAYPTAASVTALAPRDAPLVAEALAGGGIASTTTRTSLVGLDSSATATVWSRDGRPIGVVYIHVVGTADFFAFLPGIIQQSV